MIREQGLALCKTNEPRGGLKSNLRLFNIVFSGTELPPAFSIIEPVKQANVLLSNIKRKKILIFHPLCLFLFLPLLERE